MIRRLLIVPVVLLVIAPSALARPLVGSTTLAPWGDTDTAGTAEAWQYTASSTGFVQSVNLYANDGETRAPIVVGIYRDAGNHPGGLLATATIAAPVEHRWNRVSIGPILVIAGVKYWLAALATEGTLTVRDFERGHGPTEESRSHSLTGLPAAWATGRMWANSPASFYASSRSLFEETLAEREAKERAEREAIEAAEAEEAPGQEESESEAQEGREAEERAARERTEAEAREGREVEEAAAGKAEAEARKRREAEEAATGKAEAEARKRREAEEAATGKAEAEARKRREAEEATAGEKAESEARERREVEERAARERTEAEQREGHEIEEAAAKKAEAEAEAAKEKAEAEAGAGKRREAEEAAAKEKAEAEARQRREAEEAAAKEKAEAEASEGSTAEGEGEATGAGCTQTFGPATPAAAIAGAVAGAAGGARVCLNAGNTRSCRSPDRRPGPAMPCSSRRRDKWPKLPGSRSAT